MDMNINKNMSGDDKKGFSVLLLIVGAIFVIVSGGIFVSQTWNYIPDIVKRLLLVVVTGAFFAGSIALEKKTELTKAPLVLYYLGVCFAGFSTMSLLMLTELTFPAKMLLSLAVMLVPVVAHFWKKRNIADFVFQALLADGMVFCVMQFGYSDAGYLGVTLFAVVAMLFAGFAYYQLYYGNEDSRFVTVAEVLCLLHGALNLPSVLIVMFDNDSIFYAVFPILLLTGAVSAIYLVEKNRFFRFLQTVFLNLSIIGIVQAIFNQFPNDWYLDDMQIFIIYLLGLVLMELLSRTEQKVICAITMALASLGQVVGIIDREYLHLDSMRIYPYAFCMAVALLVRELFVKEKSWKQLVAECGPVFVLSAHVGLCYAFPKSYAFYYGIEFIFCLAFLMLAAIGRNGKQKVMERLMEMAALVVFLFSLGEYPIVPVRFFAENGTKLVVDFAFEYQCILALIGIVLCGFLWYDFDKFPVKMIQFVEVCVLVFVMLIENWFNLRLPNLLFFSIGVLIMFLVATMRRQKAYAYLGAITLILIALYITRNIWMSIAWWVYLFVAGIGLILYAIKREKAE